MHKAYCCLKREPVYRADGFKQGLAAAGFDVRGMPSSIERGDVLLIWNRYGEHDQLATQVEAAGGVVLVAENGYVAPGGASPHGMATRSWYALALGGHNGSGRWVFGGYERWEALNVPLLPFRDDDGGHILVCPNRSFGRPDLIMPPEWAAHVCKRLAREPGGREIRLRPHPGNNPPAKPLAEDLAGARACVIWSSSAGVHALIAGVPVICEGPRWICRGASGATLLDADYMGPQHRAFELRLLAWAQWHIDEIASGMPIARLYEYARKGEAVTA